MSERPVSSVYVHVPFCARQCGYCDFAISVGSRPDTAAWLDAVSVEWTRRTAVLPIAKRLDTLYVGGGTPSMLEAPAMTCLREIIGTPRLSSPDLEWTAEANPESFTPELVRGWRQAGVNRVSLGVQSFHEPTLRWMGRAHGPEGARAALTRVREASFRSATLDLIFGVPSSLNRSWTLDLDAAVGSGVPHISLYGLTVEPGTPLFRAVASGKSQPVDEAQYEDEYLEAASRLAAEGYDHYEVSNFALPGHRSVHNQRYWSGDPYVGLGNGAHSYLPPVRSWNVRAWIDYRDRMAAGAPAEEESEVVDGDPARIEQLWLGLRSSRGVLRTEIEPTRLTRWLQAGHAVLDDGRVRLTPTGWLLLDELAVDASADPPATQIRPAGFRPPG